MDVNKIIAKVTNITEHGGVDAKSMKSSSWTVKARMCEPAHQYSNGLYFVKILKPLSLGHLQHEQGSQMENGDFQFDATEKVNLGDELEISVTPVTTEETKQSRT